MIYETNFIRFFQELIFTFWFHFKKQNRLKFSIRTKTNMFFHFQLLILWLPYMLSTNIYSLHYHTIQPVYVHIYTYIYACIYMYIIYIYIYIYIYKYIYIWIYVSVFSFDIHSHVFFSRLPFSLVFFRIWTTMKIRHFCPFCAISAIVGAIHICLQ